MDYCIGAIFSEDLTKILLVKKNPKNLSDTVLAEHLRGKLNFIGGKLENDESGDWAIIRECREETGLELNFIHFATLDTKSGKVYCYYCVTDKIFNYKQLEHEKLGIYRIDDFDEYSSEDYDWMLHNDRMANLNYLIPMAINHYKELDTAKSFEIKEIY